MGDVRLTPREMQVLHLVQADVSTSLRAMAKELGISYQRVGQLLARLIDLGVIDPQRLPRRGIKVMQRHEIIERARQAHKDAVDNYFKRWA